jgi:hypothetical protein
MSPLQAGKLVWVLKLTVIPRENPWLRAYENNKEAITGKE